MSISLEAISSIGSMMSGLAVLGSLVYLSLQVKQAEKNQQAIIQQARSTRNAEFNVAIAENTQLTDAFLKAYSAESLTMDEWFRFNSVQGSYFQHAEDSYYQHKHGLLPEDAFHGFENTLRVVVARPCARVAWKIVRARFNADFIEFIDDLIATTPVAPPFGPSLLAQWKNDMAAELAKVAAPE
jgi:hypothetical protein